MTPVTGHHPDVTRRRVLAPLLALLAVVALVLPGQASAALPVPYTPLTPTGLLPSPPGSNDFTCTPTAAHPRPVVLLHGLGANDALNFSTLSPLLKNNGYCVFSLTYGRQSALPPGFSSIGGLQALETSGPSVAAFVDRVLAATGSAKVDLVGHSEGTVMSRYYTRFGGGATKVDKVVGLTPLWNGTTLGPVAQVSSVAGQAGLDPLLGLLFTPTCGSCREFLTGSPFLQRLNAQPTVPGITYTNIATRYDELVIPYTSGFVSTPRVTNITLQDACPLDFAEHVGVAYSPNATQLVLRALDPAHAKPFRCVPNTPLGGLAP